MKKIFYLLLFFCAYGFAQEVNKFDENGKRHGIWKKNFEGTDQLRYQGQFEHGKEVGLFKFYRRGKSDAPTATKLFNKENHIAEVKFFASNGRLISEGKMDGKKRIGEWKYYHKNSDKVMTSEMYENGELNGTMKVYYKKGTISETFEYVNGVLNGDSKKFYPNEKLMHHLIYKDNKLHGFIRYYDVKTQVTSEGRYKNDKRVGVWKYYENGELVKEKDYSASKNPYKQKLKEGEKQ